MKAVWAHAAWLAPLLPLAALSFRLRVIADDAGQSVGAELAWLMAPLAPGQPLPEQPADLLTDLASAPAELADEDEAPSHGKGKAHARRSHRLPGVYVSAQRVLALAARGVVPRGVPVAATRARPAGLLLRGANALGIGVQDGDVLTEAAGVPATSAAAVAGAVISARSRHALELSGRIFRGAEPYSIVVEQPYELPELTPPR